MFRKNKPFVTFGALSIAADFIFAQQKKRRILFGTYLELGVRHVADIRAYDHIVFIIAMAASYTFSEWKKLAVMVTSFTVGHSITLALAAFKVVLIPADIIEFLIPITILITASLNLFKKGNRINKLKYVLVLFFGLIHGMGFSYLLIDTIPESYGVVMPLLAFNLGIELGQLLILCLYFLITFLVLKIGNASPRDWLSYVCGMASGISLILIVNQTG